MENLTTFISLSLAPVTGVASYLVGRRKRDNDFLQQLQESINLLTKENANLLKEIVEVKRENVNLQILLAEQEAKLLANVKKNCELERKIDRLEKAVKVIRV